MNKETPLRGERSSSPPNTGPELVPSRLGHMHCRPEDQPTHLPPTKLHIRLVHSTDSV